jgi:hypothetical protein
VGVNIQVVLFIIPLSKAGLSNKEPAAIMTCRQSAPSYRHNKSDTLYYIFHDVEMDNFTLLSFTLLRSGFLKSSGYYTYHQV